MAEPNFALALRQRNLQNPQGVAETALPDTGGGVRSYAGIEFQDGSVPNFALALQQGMPQQGLMADTPPQFMDPGRLSLGQAFRTGLGTGVDQTQQIGGALFRMLGREFGSNALETFGQNIIDANQEEIENNYSFVHSIGDIDNFDDFLEWAAGGLGNAIPSLATAAAGGGLGGAIGRQVVKRRIANEMTDRMLGNMAAQGFARDAAEASVSRTLRNPATARILRDYVRRGDAVDLRRGTMRGAGIGTYIPSSALMTGEAEQAGTGTGGALAAGLSGGLLETAVLARAVRRFFPGVDKMAADNFIKDFAKATASQAVLEGSQEGAQQVIQMAALAYHDPSFDLLDPDNAMQVADAFAVGALVGGVLGAGGSAVGQGTIAVRDARERQGIRGSAGFDDGGLSPFDPPEIGPQGGPDSGLPPDFEPADNTLAEELRGRVNDIMRTHVSPAMNTIQRQVADIAARIRSQLPGATSAMGTVVEPVKRLNNEFIAGTAPVIDEIRRYAGEQIAYITEAAQEIPEGPMRDKFIAEELAATDEEIARVAADITERAEQVARTAEKEVLQMELSDILDNEMFLTGGADPEFTFGMNERLMTRAGVPYQRPTRGDRAVPFPKRSQAETWLKRLRQGYPSANEDTFEIIDNPNGEGFFIRLADQLQRDDLLEDEVVTFGLQNARTSARGNPDKSRQVRLENKTTIDVPTLVFQGKRLDRGEHQSLSEAFAAITGRLLDRNVITDQDFTNLSKVFESHFTNDERVANVRLIEERQAAIDRGDFTPTPKQKKPETEEAAERREQREREREARKRYDALEGQERRSVTDAVNQVLDDRGFEGTDRGKAFNAVLVKAFETLDNDPTALRNLGQELATLDPNDFGFDSALEFAETEDEQAARAAREATGRNPKERDIPAGPGNRRGVVRARQNERLAKEEAADKARAAKRKAKRKKPTMRTPHKKVATRKPAKSAGKRAKVWLPSKNKEAQRRSEEAVTELVEKVLQLIPEQKTELRVINREAARQMIARNHPDAHLLHFVEDIPIAAIRWGGQDGNATYIVVPEMASMRRNTNMTRAESEGMIGVGIVHELGHYIHYETWESLSREGQDALIQAFRDDVRTGKFRPTDPGEALLSKVTGNPRRPMQDNLFEFREWMADQMVDWMMNRRRPRTALEKFLEKVSVRIQALWDFVKGDPGRYGMLNETYADFVDHLATRIRNPEAGNNFWFREGTKKRSAEMLMGGPYTVLQMQMSPQAVTRLRRSLEQYPRIATSANKTIEFMTNAWRVALAPSTSYMRTLSDKGIRAADELVRIFNRQPHGTSKVGREITQNYHQARELEQGRFLTEMKKILQGASEAELVRLGQELRAMDGNENMVPTTARGRQVRALLDKMHEYAKKDAGLPLGKIANYFPRIFDREKLIAGEQEIITYLTRTYERQMSAQQRAEDPGAAAAEARKTYNSLISQDADAAAAMRELARDPLATQTPAGGFMRSRVASDKFFADYYNDNVESVLANYINTVTKRAEYNRFLGQKAFPQQTGGDALPRSRWDPRKKLKDILQDARQQGATDDELQYMKKYVEANLGMYGRDDIPDGARKTLAAVVAYQNMRTLLFSVFASLPDAMGPAIRSGSTRGAFKALFKNIGEISRNGSDTADMARTWGIISDVYNQHVLSEYVDNHFMPKGIRKWNDAFFKWTGLNFWTDFTRKAALAVGVDTIRQKAIEAQTAPSQARRDRATQFLGELGLTPSQVNRWVSRGQPVWGGMTYTETNQVNERADRAVANALVQFVDESILRPNPSQRPLLASHPAMMLFYHLKGFMYAIHDTILKRLVHNFNIAKTPTQIAAVFVPAIGMMLLTAIGLELRELIAGTNRTDRMDGWEYTWEVFERTGLPGLTQYAWDFDSASARGQSELAGLGGPALSQVGDLISKPVSQTIPKSIPVVSQLPWARDFLREATPL